MKTHLLIINLPRLVMEFPSTGGVLTSWIVRTSKLLRYVSSFDYGIATCEIIFILYVIYYTIEEILDVILFLLKNNLFFFKKKYLYLIF